MNTSVPFGEARQNEVTKGRSSFNEAKVISKLKHYLPEQAALKDFIHQNTLTAFQDREFFNGIHEASAIFGHRVTLSIEEFRGLYDKGSIREEVLDHVIVERKGTRDAALWKDAAIHGQFAREPEPRIGMLRAAWKNKYKIDLDSLTQPILFRVLGSYLDQGISIWRFPVRDKSFLEAIREIEREAVTSYFRGRRARHLLLATDLTIEWLLDILIGDPTLYERYLFDQQFSHPGWSGMVAVVERTPETLLDQRAISLRDLILFELLLEIDALDHTIGDDWMPLGKMVSVRPEDLFAPVPRSERFEVLQLWQEAFEWSYYDQVLEGLREVTPQPESHEVPSFQGLFCLDDRECSFRRYIEQLDPNASTFATPGFFNVEFYFQPAGGKSYAKVCPAPVTPKHLIKEYETSGNLPVDIYFSKHTHSFHGGWLISQTLGFWSALKLAWNIFRPTISPATTSSFKHMARASQLTIENKGLDHQENGLQIGFTVEEMTTRVRELLLSIGLVKDFAPIVYVIGHGASSVNNPHFAAYDCGACAGHPGSVNARVFCYMANHSVVREQLEKSGITIPASTKFVGGLHDTTRDEIEFYDLDESTPSHTQHQAIFEQALALNAKERARRFESIPKKSSVQHIHERVKRRSVSLFEPRPELNHATNALLVVGRRTLTKGLFLDRRSFMNSYDYRIDPTGEHLLKILKPAAPVCGGINLEYYFSRVDNQKLGAGTKLPHNVMGLFAVANGIDGDLRTGLPSQMIEVHDPVRLMVIVEHHPETVLAALQRSPETYGWFLHGWLLLTVVTPTKDLYVFNRGAFEPYIPVAQRIAIAEDVASLIDASSSTETLPVYKLSNADE